MSVPVDIQAKIAAILACDSLFEAYEIIVTPADIAEVALKLPPIGAARPESLLTLIHTINASVPRLDFGPGNPATGKPGHQYRIGREKGRLLAVELFKGHFRRRQDYWAAMETIERLARGAGGPHVSTEESDSGASVRMLWD